VAVLRPGGELQLGLVGDVGARLMRAGAGQVSWTSDVQEHSFNTPFQLAHQELLPITDNAADGLNYQLQLQPGDVLVAGSDGLFDNMWDHQLAALVAAAAGESSRCDGRGAHMLQSSLNRDSANPVAACAGEKWVCMFLWR
jgi:hypothetical protein